MDDLGFTRDPLQPHQRAIEIGTAGEYLVCADLLLQGFRTFPASQGLPYDVVVDVSGQLIRVAVKSALKASPRPAREGSRVCYQFAVTRSRRRSTGKTDARPYSTDDVDVVALVALDLRAIAYISMRNCKTSMHLDAPGHDGGQNKFGPKRARRKRFDDFTFSNAIGGLL